MPAAPSPLQHPSLPLRRFAASALAAFPALLLSAALLCPVPASATPSAEAPPAGAALPFSPLDGLKFPTPSSFAELGPETPLFRESEAQAVRRGRLLKLWLPQHMARQYHGGSPDAVTRQILLCAPEGQPRPLDAKDAELLARSAEGLFIGFARIPRSSTDTPAQEEQNRAAALRSSLEKGRPLLVDSVRTSSAFLHTCLLHFSMGEKKENVFLPCALATAVVPVKGAALFLTVTSLLGQDEPEPHLAWVKETAMTFADALAKANRDGKK
ncbi:MAG: hypothetical protein IJD65_05740 [Mailhella sp.]|nr:hypothetical protein [Mailhella sp.]